MNRIKVFEQFNNIEAFFTEKPEKTETLIPEIVSKLSGGEYFIKPWMVHGKHVQVADSEFLSASHVEIQGYPELQGKEGYIEVPDTDGLVTDIPGVALVTTHGDCIPVYVYDPVKKVIGVAHAGWKGTMLGIAGELAKVMKQRYGSKGADIYAFIGPGIGKCHFEVKDDVKSQFEAEEPWMTEFIEKKDEEHYYIDLKHINERYLRLEGLENIEISGECTYCLEERFWSYRRCGDTARMLAYIKIL